MKTSETSPLRVDFLPVAALDLRGRVGMTLAPGKKAPGASGRWDRSLEADLDRIRNVFRAGVLVSLVEDHELDALGIGALPAACARHGLDLVRFPIADGGVPASSAAFDALVADIVARATDGWNIVIHCRGGLGRTGLVAAACLVTRGHTPASALRAARAARPGAVETPAQERYLADYAARATRTATIARVPSVSRFRGALLAGALGDALGYPIEFEPRASIELRSGAVSPGAHVSDDTQMTLFVAEGVIRAIQRWNDRGIASVVNVVQRALLRWRATQTPGLMVVPSGESGWLIGDRRLHVRRAPGTTNLEALGQQARRFWTPTLEAAPNHSKGCGAIMRSAPFGLAASTREQAFESARDSALTTHGHPSGYLAAAYFAALVHDLSRGVGLASALAHADRLLARERGFEEVRAAVDRARAVAAGGAPSAESIESLGGGWVAEEALAIALACVLSAGRPGRGAMRAALWRAAAHGGDSDSTASLAGNLLGAAWGEERLPPEWVAKLELCDVIVRVSDDLHAVAVVGAEFDHESYPPN